MPRIKNPDKPPLEKFSFRVEKNKIAILEDAGIIVADWLREKIDQEIKKTQKSKGKK